VEKIMKIFAGGCRNLSIASGNAQVVVVNEGSFFEKSKKWHQTKHIGMDGIRKIRVNSELADVIIEVSDREDMKVQYYGDVCTEANPEFIVTIGNEEVCVMGKASGDIFYGNLKIHMLLPKKVFDLISVECRNGSAKLCKNVEARRLKLVSSNGNIRSEATFKEMNAKSRNGSIQISTYAKQDIEILASSENGHVHATLDNIATCNIVATSINGHTEVKHHSNGQYKATGKIESGNGHVIVQ